MASGVDAERFARGPSSVVHRLLPRPRVMFTGRLHPQKNLPLLLEAWTDVAGKRHGSLILVGPGNERQRLMELARSLGIADRVQFAGAVDNPAEYLRAADIFVLPSLAEGMSNSLLEAMATALPCAVSGIGGNTDLIDKGTGRPLGRRARPGRHGLRHCSNCSTTPGGNGAWACRPTSGSTRSLR